MSETSAYQYGAININDHFLSSNLNAVIATDRNLNINIWNKGAESIYGWNSDEVLQKASTEIRNGVLDILTRPEVIRSISEVGSWFGKGHGCTKNGSKVEVWIYMSVLWNSSGSFNGILTIHRETTKRKELEGMLTDAKGREHVKLTQAHRSLRKDLNRQQQTRMEVAELAGKNQDLINNIKLGVFRSTPGANGKFLEVNKAMEGITGYSEEELLQMNVRDLFSENHEKE